MKLGRLTCGELGRFISPLHLSSEQHIGEPFAKKVERRDQQKQPKQAVDRTFEGSQKDCHDEKTVAGKYAADPAAGKLIGIGKCRCFNGLAGTLSNVKFPRPHRRKCPAAIAAIADTRLGLAAAVWAFHTV